MSDIKPQPAVSLEIKAEKGSENKPPGMTSVLHGGQMEHL